MLTHRKGLRPYTPTGRYPTNMNEYQSIPVFPLPADLGQSVKRSLRYEPEEVNLGYGTEPAVPIQEYTKERVEATCLAQGGGVLDEVEAFFEGSRGQFKAFWLATSVADFTIVGQLDQTTFLVTSGDYETTWPTLAGKQVQLRAPDGSLYFREVIGVSSSTYPGYEMVTLDAALSEVPNGDWTVSRLLLTRLTSDELEFAFEADNVARIQFSVIEVPHEYAAPNALATRRPVFLYRITRRYGVRNIYCMHLTSHDTPIQSGSVTYHPVPIDHGGLSVSTEGDTDRLDLELYAWDGNPFEDWLPIHIGQPTGVILSQSHVDELTGLVLEAPTILYRGIIETAARFGPIIQAKAISPLAYGDKRVPRFFLQTRCNYQLFDGSTCRAAEATYRLNGSIEAIDAEEGSLDFECADLAGKAADWLPGGFLEIGTPPSVEVRTIRNAQTLTATRQRLFLNASLRTSQVGDTCIAWPGCNRTPDHCTNKFDNFVNYGGHPFIPYDNPTLKAMPLQNPASGGGKK